MAGVKHTPVERATFEFTNRDGVPTKLVIDPPPGCESFVRLWVHPDGSTASAMFQTDDFPNSGGNYRYLGNEEDPPAVASVAARQPVKPMGKVGVFMWSVVGLAILTPFLGILWAWAAGVVRNFGGLW